MSRSHRPHDLPAFFAPDFFLRDEQPWIVPDEVEEIRSTDLIDRLPAHVAAAPVWSPLDTTRVCNDVEDALRCIRERGWTKVVPVWFERGEGALSPSDVGALIRRALGAPPVLAPYALSLPGEGIVGASPELLFTIEGDGVVHTSAIAGTCRQRGDTDIENALLSSDKDRREHDVVKDYIRERLSPLGEVTVDALRVVHLPTLAHLATPITLKPKRGVSFEELVRALHPTPALGALPLAEGLQWLTARERLSARYRYGAPFGFQRADGSAICLVAIRNLQWSGSALTLGAGCGIVEGSEPMRELDEVRAKLDSVHKLLGI